MSLIGPVVSEEKMFENVDGRRTDGLTTDPGVTGILLANQWAFRSDELKTDQKMEDPDQTASLEATWSECALYN